MEEKKPKQNLTIYLLKESVHDLNRIIKNIDQLTHIEIESTSDKIGDLYIKRSYSNPPRWAQFFEGVIDINEFGENSSTAAIFIIEIRNRLFALSFGHGRYLIDSTYLEMGFGLRVALNSIDEHSLKSIDKSTFEAYPKQSREQSGIEAELQYFQIDVEQDLLRAVTGRPLEKEFGDRVTGMDALRINARINLETLKQYLNDVLYKYNDTYYKQSFGWVDHIGEVKDKELIEELDSQLIQKITDSICDNIWLAVPEIIDWTKVVGFTFTGRKKIRYYDIRISDFLESIDGEFLTKELLLQRKITCVDEDFNPLFERAAYFFIYGEVTYNHNTFLINNGKWYRINRDFVVQINKSYSSITRYESYLPIYEDKTETEYNKRVADEDSKQYALMDCKNIRVPDGTTPIEFCDLYSNKKELIHVKRYGGSSVLSHLFNQGVVSGELFKMNEEFRKAVNERLPNSHKIGNTETRPTAGQYKVIYAIISEYDEELSIPFFSKISLKNAVNRLEAFGYNVELARISVDENFKKRRVVKEKKPGY